MLIKITDLSLNIACESKFPSISICQILFLIIEEFTMINSGILIVEAFNDSIDRAWILTKSEINAFGYLDII